MNPLRTTIPLPTHRDIALFLSTFLPYRPRDVPYHYHLPRPTATLPPSTSTTHLILSITPTPGVYTAINHPGLVHPPVVFLHRPFNLDRRSIRRGTTVVASHVAFDEVLTVGWNTVLAGRLGMDLDDCLCVQGYKGDPERRIGIVGRVDTSPEELVARIRREFGGEGEVHGFGGETVRVVAIMNAFHAEEVERVLGMAWERGWIDTAGDGREVLYLTGEPRAPGLEAAQIAGMNVVCVGHRVCEEWGIRYLASCARQQYPSLEVIEIYEDEPPPPPKVKRTKGLQAKLADAMGSPLVEAGSEMGEAVRLP